MGGCFWVGLVWVGVDKLGVLSALEHLYPLLVTPRGLVFPFHTETLLPSHDPTSSSKAAVQGDMSLRLCLAGLARFFLF